MVRIQEAHSSEEWREVSAHEVEVHRADWLRGIVRRVPGLSGSRVSGTLMERALFRPGPKAVGPLFRELAG